MMGHEKLSTIRERLRGAFGRETTNPVVSLDRRIRRLEQDSASNEGKLRSLRLLRDALAQVVEKKPRKKAQTTRTRRTKNTT